MVSWSSLFSFRISHRIHVLWLSTNFPWSWFHILVLYKYTIHGSYGFVAAHNLGWFIPWLLWQVAGCQPNAPTAADQALQVWSCLVDCLCSIAFQTLHLSFTCGRRRLTSPQKANQPRCLNHCTVPTNLYSSGQDHHDYQLSNFAP